MLKTLLAGILLLCSFTPAKDGPWFSGLIVYHNEFRDAAGEVVESRAGAQDLFYIQGSNYKLCNGKKETRELYVGKTRTLQMLQNGRVVTAPDTARHQIQLVATHLPTTAVILGRPCQAVQLMHGGTTSIIYYSLEVRVKSQGFRTSPFGYWYALLRATNGALPLRTISVYSKKGYTATSEATAIKPMALSATDFTIAAPAR
ncbi:hypothetical protein [Hymenobacter psoromatis]|uniref:hypothetical protein n=1 Tax=Hymenobacter psoromatis TaxID=1484116 RepID=UPI001CBC150C|nr:hypothetical protein [Hymenobacter psoromatis]